MKDWYVDTTKPSQPIMQAAHGSAVISPCGLYRYELRRVWDDTKPLCAWIMLNPSTADAMKDDPTIRKCIGFTRQWNQRAGQGVYGGIVVGNLFAFRSTDPRGLLDAADPVGPGNIAAISRVVDGCDRVMVAWGGLPAKRFEAMVQRAIHEHRLRYRSIGGPESDGCTMCLGRTKSGQPRHPLMLAYSTPTEAW